MVRSATELGTRILHGVRTHSLRITGAAPPGVFLENRPEARRLLSLADRAFAAGALGEASTLALRVLQVAPASQESLHLLGRIYDACGEAELAFACHRGQLAEDIWQTHTGSLTAAPSGRAAVQRSAVFGRVRLTMPSPGQCAPAGPMAFERNEITSAPCFVDHLQAGRVWQDSHNTLVLDANSVAVEEHTTGNPHVVRHLSERHEPVHFRGRVFVLGARGSGNYYHWMTDILPKLELCERAGLRVQPEDHVIVPTRRADFQLQTLARFGIRERQIHVANVASPWVSADELIVPHLRNAMGTTMGAWLPGFLKDSFLPPEPRKRPSRRLFVSRDVRRSQGRGIANLAEVERCFAKRGFEVVYPETLDVLGQAQLFSEAAIVASPHGAGLTNIVFCAPGTRILEFYGAHLAPCYRAISALSDLRYFAHYCLDDDVADMDDAERARSLTARRIAGFSISPTAIDAMVDLADSSR